MNYQDTLAYLYASAPVYEREGAAAYKPGLDTCLAFDERLDHPHHAFRSIHVAGTNGKGSVCHTLAAVLQQAGYRTGLYTSPHLIDFRERIRVNGQMIDQDYVTDFVERHRTFFEPLHPSFFEIVTAMAFDYFRHEQVDIAIIETGLGGRLDSTNIITPILSIITNISKDHTQLLGETLGEIAYEKAGIIKEGVPVVIGEKGDETTQNVFTRKAQEMHAPVAPDEPSDFGPLTYGIRGWIQAQNIHTILKALRQLNNILPQPLPREAVAEGFRKVVLLTGLRGRWEELSQAPYIVTDTAHNPGAWTSIAKRLEYELTLRRRVFVIIGFSNDKDVDEMLRMLPSRISYIFTQAQSERALPASALAHKASIAGLNGMRCTSVEEAVNTFMSEIQDNDLLFIGGSHFVVAEALPLFAKNPQWKTNNTAIK